MSRKYSPYVQNSEHFSEITFKGILLGIILAILLSASTCYIGLKIGRSMAASIPAAVVSIGVFRLFRKNNILENNITQTTASVSEAVAGASIFVLPALVMLGVWDNFHYVESFIIITLGGLLGVIFCIPIRKTLIIEKDLPYPEGIATAEILMVGDSKKNKIGLSEMLKGGIIASTITFMQSGFKFIGDEISKWVFVKDIIGTGEDKTTILNGAHTVIGGGISLAPVLFAAGYIVGFGVCISMLLGSVITWIIGVPLYTTLYDLSSLVPGEILNSDIRADQVVQNLYQTHLRYIGIGAVAVSGIWGIMSLLPDMLKSIKTSIQSIKKSNVFGNIPSTERDIPAIILLFFMMIVVFGVYYALTLMLKKFNFSDNVYIMVLMLLLLGILVISFLCSGISSYLTGILGSTSLPVSSITLTAIFLIGVPLFYIINISTPDADLNTQYMHYAEGVTLIIAAFIAIVIGISSDNMQDLKAGYIVGATPWKQQVALLIGVVAAATVIAPVLNLLLDAYGIGSILPKVHSSDSPTLEQTLVAPQATMMATIVSGIFRNNFPKMMLFIGGMISIAVICLDLILCKCKAKFRISALSVSAGMYLPMTYIISFCIGGFVHYIAEKKLTKKISKFTTAYTLIRQRGILFASGIIAGESLVGVLLAIPFAMYGRDDIFAYWDLSKYSEFKGFLGFFVIILICVMLYTITRHNETEKTNEK